ncbi:MAG: glycosyltransferase family 2 protein [Thermogemmata sp.]|jgi:rSAM/selenodomain-associated transferase 2|uniref:Glycosyltransferase family 2 protein n=1 Tax=Thermogemmata fonticola TaxID=2755323 RepID=A0A7V8VFM2_9BACT|nr:glycosyltransferase family 2 protein [Thermogemmata fonticola]MBA2227158.1 glycosyltransferase family 2 protein [Thermogemmata fonticola]
MNRSMTDRPSPSRTLTLAVIVPTWQEADCLPLLLQSLQEQSAPAECIVVADGGSTDGTAAIAEQGGALVLSCPQRGRGRQIAYALDFCPQDIILIAHADMIFPPVALERVRQRLADHPEIVGGCLGHRFDSAAWWYRLVEWADRRRARRGLAYGDQAQFFRRSVLEAIGGFPPWPFLEDVALSRRLQLSGPLAYLDLPVTVSPRRFQKRGLLPVLWQNWRIRRRLARHGETIVEKLYQEYYAAPPPAAGVEALRQRETSEPRGQNRSSHAALPGRNRGHASDGVAHG